MGSIEPVEGGRRLVARGEFDLRNRERLRAAVERAVAGRRLVEIDFENVTFIDAGSVRVLVQCRQAAAAAGCDIRIVNASGGPRRVLQMLGVPLDPTAGRAGRVSYAMVSVAELLAASGSAADGPWTMVPPLDHWRRAQLN